MPRGIVEISAGKLALDSPTWTMVRTFKTGRVKLVYRVPDIDPGIFYIYGIDSGVQSRGSTLGFLAK